VKERPTAYKIEILDDFHGFIKFDDKKNESDALIVAEVTARSRKKYFRVVHHGQIIGEFDFRKKRLGFMG
jgi:hypothetical protein